MKKQYFDTLPNFPRVANSWKVIWLLLSAFYPPSVSEAQNAEIQTRTIPLTIEPIFKDKPIVLNGTFYHLPTGDSLQITNLKFYLSHIELWEKNALVWAEVNSVHLVDLAEPSTLEWMLNPPKMLSFDALTFNLGIDSLTNVSGALGGDLDPTKGMYWAWQSGYVNFKLEGKSNVCPTRKNIFQFHLGGYLPPFYGLQTVELPLDKHLDKTVVQLDIHAFLSKIDLKQQNSIMIPCDEAVVLAQQMAQLFKIKEK